MLFDLRNPHDTDLGFIFKVMVSSERILYFVATDRVLVPSLMSKISEVEHIPTIKLQLVVDGIPLLPPMMHETEGFHLYGLAAVC